MPLNFPDRKARREKLYNEYLTLTPHEQTLVQFLSFSEDHISVQDLLAFLENAGIKDSMGAVVKREGWKKAIHACKAKEVIVEQYSSIECARDIREVCARHSFQAGNFDLVTSLIDKNKKKYSTYFFQNLQENLRRAVVSGKADGFFLALSKSGHYAGMSDIRLAEVFNQPFDEADMIGIGPEYVTEIMADVMQDAHHRLESADEACAFLKKRIAAGEDPTALFIYLLGSHLLLKGRFGEYDVLRSAGRSPLLLIAMEKAIKGDDEHAIEAFETVLKAMRKKLGRRNVIFGDFSDGLFFLSLIRTNKADNRKRARIHLSQTLKESDYSEHGWTSRFGMLSCLFDDSGLFLGRPNVCMTLSEDHLLPDPIGIWIEIMTGYWLNADVSAKNIGLLTDAFRIVIERGYCWLASEIADLLYRLTGKESFQADVRAFRGDWTSASLVDAVRKTEPWERTLDALKTLSIAPSGKKTEENVRLVWEIHLPEDVHHGYGLFIEAKERKLLKNGRWSTGKRLNPQTFNNGHEQNDLLTDQDRLVLKTLARVYSGQNEIAIEALAELAGHPAVFWRNEPDVRVEIEKREPHLMIASKSGEYRITLEPSLRGFGTQKYAIQKEAADRVIVYAIKPQHVQVASILGNAPVSIPAKAREMLLATITAISPHLSVRTDIDDSLKTSESVEPDGRPAVRLSDRASGLHLEFAVCPVPEGRLYQAGRGSQIVYETIDGKTFHTQRVFSEEKRLLEKLIEECPIMASHIENPMEPALIDDPLECLEVLDELKRAEPGVIMLRQEKKPVTVTAFSPGKASFRVRPAGDWFGIDGEVTIDNGRVISFRTLLDLLDTARGRFIPLDENTYLALTREFKRRLERLRAFCSTSDGETRLHPLAALTLSDLSEDLPAASLCDEWKANVARMQSVFSDVPPQPSSLAGDLRDYQKDGFVWLARLSALGAGACLADDMGLGKTIQAIALLLHRARGGAALVIAPTSVCMNWVEEIRRFAPSLSPSLLSETDRAACISGAGTADVVICSYGLVNNELELLTGRSWHTVILDEAQAIKNMTTQRSKAVMELRADFRLVTTGTPVENHLGELWNIFRFINPGLLGTINEFNRRFAAAIEGKNDQETKQRLKSVISPFVLRRLKSQVLDELPPKTETILYVELSDEERALYEALRARAIEELDSDGDARGRHVKILVQIMKLRRACCHPTLALPESGVQGSKLDTFGLCVDELLDNGHRALVFSQFVDHLSIVRDYCDKRQITYQYLDGSTPARERSARIGAFQSGEGSLFLMSLKAGGLGINLTSADFVILLDPWWNPAVEDQASARAHRMGQTRPVTIYRLIARGTIEEKIIELHRHKRDLAESLLEGGDMSGKMSAEELLNLIRDTV